MPALLGGHVDMSSNTLATLGAQLKAGKLRGLAIASKRRHPDYPDVPTTSELGYPDVNFSVWMAVFAPTGVPQQVVDVLVPAVEKVLNSPDVVQRGTKLGIEVDYMGPEELRKHMESQVKIVERVARDANIPKK